MAVSSAAARSRPTADPRLRARVLQLMEAEIDYIPNEAFERCSLEDPAVAVLMLDELPEAEPPADLPAHLRRMCDAELLTHEQEMNLFRTMNLLKFQADSLRGQIDPCEVDAEMLADIESRLDAAQQIRDHLIQSNVRLVMSIAKKFVTPQQSFDELLSEGIFTLMQAVEKFDYDRGFRFSTYAYRSIARNAYRSVSNARKEESRYTRDAEEWAFEEEAGSSSSMTDQVWSNLRELASGMLDKLDRRERFIIRCRYALGSHRKVRTFQCLADKLGVSKERVRQLEQRAVGKLKAMAEEHELDELFGAAMV